MSLQSGYSLWDCFSFFMLYLKWVSCCHGSSDEAGMMIVALCKLLKPGGHERIKWEIEKKWDRMRTYHFLCISLVTFYQILSWLVPRLCRWDRCCYNLWAKLRDSSLSLEFLKEYSRTFMNSWGDPFMNSATDQTKRADEKMVALSTYLLSSRANKNALIRMNTFFILTFWSIF